MLTRVLGTGGAVAAGLVALACRRPAEQARPHAAPSSSTSATSRSSAEPPISLEGFEDSARHYRNRTGTSDYARHPPGDNAAIAENVLLYQRANGGWSENWDPRRVLGSEERAKVLADKSREDTSFDNRSTYTHVTYLAEAYRRTRDERYRASALRGLEFVLRAQHACGLFPHSFPKAEGYRAHPTIMDDVTVGVLRMLRAAADGVVPFDVLDAPARERARAAVLRGESGLLRLQVVVKGEPTVWAGQYDEVTLAPTSARSFELPSLVSDESVDVVRYLMSVRPPRPEVTRAVEAAVRWFERSTIRGLRVETIAAEPVRYEFHTSTEDRRAVLDPKAPPLWARFYEIETNRPFMANRDGKKVYALAEVARERRTGYRWYGYFATDLLEKEYPAWKAALARR